MSIGIFETLVKEGEVRFKTYDGEFRIEHAPTHKVESPTELFNYIDNLYMDVEDINLTLNDFFKAYLSVEKYKEILESSNTLFKLVDKLIEELEKRDDSVTYVPIFSSTVVENTYYLPDKLDISNIEESELVGFYVVESRSEDFVAEMLEYIEYLFYYTTYYYLNSLYTIYSTFNGEEDIEFFDEYNGVVVPLKDESWILDTLQFKYDYDDISDFTLLG